MSHIWHDEQSDTKQNQRWLADYAAAHRRWCRVLYLIIGVGVASYILFGQVARGAQAQDTIPRAQLGTQSRTLAQMKVGETACTYLGWRVSKEGHVWLMLDAVAEKPCAPSVNWVLVRAVVRGWEVVVKASVPVNDWDRDYAGKGWVRAERVEVVR